MIEIDGSFGEGGGQILRTSLSLSMVTGKPFRIHSVRAAREKPGLLRQHLTAVDAAREVSKAQVTGAKLGSRTLVFTPEEITPGRYTFDIGTAGSTTLVLQTLLPALITAKDRSKIELRGGTHNPFAPTFEFLDRTFIPLVCRLGPAVSLKLSRYGFYPKGGGILSATIDPCRNLASLHLDHPERHNKPEHLEAEILIVNLPRHIAERESRAIKSSLAHLRSTRIIESDNSPGSGNVVTIYAPATQLCETLTAIGRRGLRAEKVAATAVQETRNFLDSPAAVGEFLADQLVLPLAMAGSGSFATTTVSGHLRTNIDTITKFLDVRIQVRQVEGASLVEISKAS